jgi:hypothetical protein
MSYAQFQKQMIWKKESSGPMKKDFSSRYHVIVREKYMLTDDSVTSILNGTLTIDQALVKAHSISHSTAYHVMKNRISIRDVLSGKDFLTVTPQGLLGSLFRAVRSL